jgi:hypothetical protein
MFVFNKIIYIHTRKQNTNVTIQNQGCDFIANSFNIYIYL